MVCLVGTTAAWSSAAVQVKPQTIAAASFDATIFITDEKEVPVALDEPLKGSMEYSITLKATGNASYCVLQTGNIHVTPSMKPDEALSFTLIPARDGTYFHRRAGQLLGQGGYNSGLYDWGKITSTVKRIFPSNRPR